MRVVYHIGAHLTDQDRLVRSLLRNRDALLEHGIAVPGPGTYRKILRDVVNKLRGARPIPDAQDVILEAISSSEADTLFLSNESFVSLPEKAVDEGIFYPRAHKTAWLRNTFPDAEVDFAIALRDPATFLPALARATEARNPGFALTLAEIDPLPLRWSDLIRRIAEYNPDCGIIVWCNEDTPLIWGEIMREVTGLDPITPLEGDLDMAMQIMTEEGQNGLASYLAANPPDTEVLRRRIVSAFLERYAAEDVIEEPADLPGWTHDLTERLSDLYDEDMAAIARMPGVTFISP